MTLYFFAFLSGLVTIFAPCIWPLLPIILSSGVSGGKQKPFGIIVGLSLSFLFFTLILASVLKVLPIDPEVFRLIGVVVIIILGLTLLIPKFTLILEGFVSRISSRFGGATGNKGDGFKGGFVTGAALGLVWSPCAGPILATVATIAATSGVNTTIFFIALSFVIGVSVPLFIIAFFGQKMFARMRGANKYTARIQQVFGVIIILTAFMIYTGYDKTLQVKILEACGLEDGFLAGFENSDYIKERLDALRGIDSRVDDGSKVKGSNLKNFGEAPEIEGIEAWLNTENGEALSLEALRGQVVLIDFWTYSCINCVRTIPYVKSWHEKYSDNDFTVIGVHTPEFLFEHKKENVEDAIKKYGIPYPVAQDNDYATWNAFKNRYWPAHYLIDAEGRIRYTHFGEGKYEETEKAIQTLLEEAGRETKGDFVDVNAEAAGKSGRTPETYLGLSRMERFASTPRPTAFGSYQFVLPNSLQKDAWGYSGGWEVEGERASTKGEARLRFRFNAKKVFLVMGPTTGQSAPVEVWFNGNPVNEGAGKDVQEATISVTEERLYELLSLPAITEGTLELRFPRGNVSVYAFTFS